MTPTPPERKCPTCGSKDPEPLTDCPNHWHVRELPRNNPGYTPEYKELEEAREVAKRCRHISDDFRKETPSALRWLAAEVRVMRLERALER